MPTCYFYVREFHPDSFKAGHSRQSQEEVCEAYYQYRVQPLGIPRGEVFYDPKTSARHVPFLQRTAGRRLDSLLKAGDHIIFAYLDRGYRAVKDFSQLMEDWKARGITVHFANLGVDLSTPTGMLVANIMASVAQGESDQKSERNLEIAAFRRRANRPTNGERKFGYRRAGPKGDRQFVPFKEEREVMARIIQLHDGGFTWREVSVIIESWSPKIQFPATRLFSSLQGVQSVPQGLLGMVAMPPRLLRLQEDLGAGEGGVGKGDPCRHPGSLGITYSVESSMTFNPRQFSRPRNYRRVSPAENSPYTTLLVIECLVTRARGVLHTTCARCLESTPVGADIFRRRSASWRALNPC